jgi:hypothetical protein
VSLVNKVQHVRVTPRRIRDHIRPGRPRDHSRQGDLGRLRVALCAVFAAHGFMFASWAVRVPAVKEQAGASPAAVIAWLSRDGPELSDGAALSRHGPISFPNPGARAPPARCRDP